MALMEKIRHMRMAIKQHGGLVGSFLQLYRTDELKWGDHVGTDKYGNKYYHNKLYFIGRSRWVEFTPAVGMDYDGSQIPAEWHRWLQYITDDTPVSVPPTEREWIIDHEENPSGSAKEYVPYSTTKPKIHAWVPPKGS